MTDTEPRHKEEYETALVLRGIEGPAWENLSEVQREIIRDLNRKFWTLETTL